MKIVTYKANAKIGTGAYREDGSLVDVSTVGDALALMTNRATRAKANKLLRESKRVVKNYKLLTPFAPRALICIGQNYMDHVLEMKSKPPERPVVFAKFANTLANPNDTITWHADVTQAVDWEAELGVVIGKKAYRVTKEDALNFVGGYTCLNDISARDIQKTDSGGQWVMGKTLDGFLPMGPCVVTADEIPNPQTLDIRCILNGATMQNSNTKQMIFTVAYLIAHISKFMTLMPGDIIATGTPPGVGAGRTPPVFLNNGDVVTIEIEKIGTLTNKMRVIG
jgi:2-keto-4-pentenoate hydratase/2-oxohepta-3-ene-1,7-dioic acid hydratase in catechol pathway